MEKKNKALIVVITLLVLIIVLMIGFIVLFINEFEDEKEEIRDLYGYKYDTTKPTNNNHNNDDNNHHNEELSNNNSNTTNNNSNYISKEDALKKALDDAKINQNDIYDINIELDYKYNQTVYEIDFNYQQFEYEYYINAETSDIVKSFKEIDH